MQHDPLRKHSLGLSSIHRSSTSSHFFSLFFPRTKQALSDSFAQWISKKNTNEKKISSERIFADTSLWNVLSSKVLQIILPRPSCCSVFNVDILSDWRPWFECSQFFAPCKFISHFYLRRMREIGEWREGGNPRHDMWTILFLARSPQRKRNVQ